jgi:hypothetical protein
MNVFIVMAESRPGTLYHHLVVALHAWIASPRDVSLLSGFRVTGIYGVKDFAKRLSR